jgi:hypothetical protein
MSVWDPHRDLVRLLAALSGELIASGGPEVQAACFDDGDSILTAARDVRELIGTLIDDADEPEAGARPHEAANGPALLARQH